MRENQKCAVVGGGTMGRQIALNAAIYGYRVVVCESYEPARESLIAWKEEYLQGRIEKGRMTPEQVAEIKERFAITESLAEACADAYIVIEAIVEVEEEKRKVLGEISRLTPEETIIATNSSYMVSSLFKDQVLHPERLANLHYFLPPLVNQLVEVVKGDHTSEKTVEKLMDFGRSIGKTPVLVQKEIDGFIVNNVLSAIKEEAYRLVSEGICSVEDLDTAVELGLKHPMGPFKLDDMAGIDVRANILDRRLKETGVKSNGYEMIHALYQEGKLGRKTKHGFYDYE